MDPPDSKTIGELLALLAHDLRNPLSALHSNLGFLKSLPVEGDPDVTEAIDDGVVSCDGLSHIIDNIDLFGQALRGAEPTGGSRSDLVQVARQVVTRSARAAASHGLSVELVDSGVETLSVTASFDLLERIIANLVRNGIQHAPSGTVVRVECGRSDGVGVVEIFDDGASLDDGDDNVFSAQGQVASKTATNGRYSRGLGLYCAHIAAEACGAHITFKAGDGDGNSFVLAVPLVR